MTDVTDDHRRAGARAAAGAAAAAALGFLAAFAVSAAALLAAGTAGRLVPTGALTLVAMAFGGRVSYVGPLVADERGATVGGWPLTITLVALLVLAAGVLRVIRRGSGRHALLAVVTGTGVLAVLVAAAAALGRHHESTAGGGPLRFAAGTGAGALGAAVLSGIAVAVAIVVRRPDLLGPRLRQFRAVLAGPVTVALALLAIGCGAALLLAGYAAGDSGPGRLAALLLVVPNLGVLLALVALGAPIDVSSSNGGLLADVPLLGGHVATGSGGRASLTLQHLLDAHPTYLLAPVAAATVLLAGGCWLALRADSRAEAVRQAVGLTAVLAVGVAAVWPATLVSLDLHGGGVAAPLSGTAYAAPGWAIALGALWGAVGGWLGIVAVERLPLPTVNAARRRLRLPEPPPRHA